MDPLRRFETRTERFAHGDLSLEIVLPRAADELIDVSDFNRDERLPYWADLWPSGRALARHLLDSPLPAGRVIELGCGVALPSLALRARGVEVLATDYYQEALEFTRLNAERNSIDPPPTLLLDWRSPPPHLGRFSLALAADLLYERRNADALLELLPRILEPDGALLLADPGRIYAGEFREGMAAAGWSERVEAERAEPSSGGEEGSVSRVRITRWARGVISPGCRRS